MAAITASQCFRLKLLHILETAGQQVMTYTLLCGTAGKAPSDTLEQYLQNLPQGSTANYAKVAKKSKCFNSTDQTQIINDTTCTTFDITLLHKAIKISCENVASLHPVKNNPDMWNSKTLVQPWDLEYYVTKIKDTRNEVVHEHKPFTEADFLKEVADLILLFVSSLKATKDRYARDDAEYQAKEDAMLDTVKDIRAENLGEDEILQRSTTMLLPLLKQETDKELRTRLDSARYIDPLHFLSGVQGQRVEVSNIFCDIILAEEKRTARQGEVNEIPYLEMLHLCDDAGASASGGSARPHILVVEGEAGSGKTTLATFLLNQWLERPCDRRVQGLQLYDQLLWVVCRDQNSSSLRDFLKVLLHESYFRYGHLLLPLLKKCRVLILIDGLDERNDVSRQLVTDILGETAATTFTIVCTSRPESVPDMKTRARANFHVSHVKMLGIDHTERTELVVRHYAWVTGGANTAANTAALRRVMQHIGSRELFRLPINLLFLATLFFYDPDKVSVTITQSELYQFIHMWCEQKLQDRLGAASQAGRARVFRQGGVAGVLSVMYKVALKGLLQGRVYLSDEDLRGLRDECIKQDLDPEEVLPAFYNLRREVSFGVVTESYCHPHKGLQDFFGAKHIAEQLDQYREGAIKRVLQVSSAGQDPRLDQLRNMLIHLLGLLTRQRGTVATAMQEAVDLLRQSGVKKNDEWLFLLADTGAHDVAVQRVVQNLNVFHEDEIIYVLDGTVNAASVLLPRLPPRKVRVHLTREPANVDDLERGLAGHIVRHLNLVYHFRHPHQHAASASAHLLRHIPRSDLWMFIGHLDDGHLKLLPRGLQQLYLVVAGSDHARSLLPALAKALSDLPSLQTIELHVPVAAVTPSAVSRLPATAPSVSLVLSGVTDQLAGAAGKIVAALKPPKKGFSALNFPGATLELRGWEAFIQELQQAGVTVRSSVLVPDTHITDDEADTLSAITTTRLGCRLFRRGERAMWP